MKNGEIPALVSFFCVDKMKINIRPKKLGHKRNKVIKLIINYIKILF